MVIKQVQVTPGARITLHTKATVLLVESVTGNTMQVRNLTTTRSPFGDVLQPFELDVADFAASHRDDSTTITPASAAAVIATYAAALIDAHAAVQRFCFNLPDGCNDDLLTVFNLALHGAAAHAGNPTHANLQNVRALTSAVRVLTPQ